MKQSRHTHLTNAHTHLILPELVHLLGFTEKKAVTMVTATTKVVHRTVFNAFMTILFL